MPKLLIEDDLGKSGPIFAGHRTNFNNGPLRSAVTHDFAALAFYTGGGSTMEQRAVWTLEPGDLFIVPPGEPHRLIEGRRPEFWGVGFCVPCLPAELLTPLIEPFERVRDGASPVVRIPAARHHFLETLLSELSAGPAERSVDPLSRQSLLTLVVNEIRRAASWSTSSAGESNIVTESLRYVERHCLQPLKLDDIATAVNRTPSYITTALRKATGRSAGEWIIAGRMAEARRRLLYSDERIDIIAERVGYADTTHFIRTFRRAHGSTPVAWRATQRFSAVPKDLHSLPSLS